MQVARAHAIPLFWEFGARPRRLCARAFTGGASVSTSGLCGDPPDRLGLVSGQEPAGKRFLDGATCGGLVGRSHLQRQLQDSVACRIMMSPAGHHHVRHAHGMRPFLASAPPSPVLHVSRKNCLPSSMKPFPNVELFGCNAPTGTRRRHAPPAPSSLQARRRTTRHPLASKSHEAPVRIILTC